MLAITSDSTNPVSTSNVEDSASTTLNALTSLMEKMADVSCITLPTERILAMTGHQNGLVVTFTIVSIGDDKQLNYTTHMWNRCFENDENHARTKLDTTMYSVIDSLNNNKKRN
jgi:hypothetical protein